ncbi:hypothetical protein ElyMa_006509700 [Elysia marginata]|uniref:Uncharacterized protein n=1 Tax=Elysia marginata TaxID=1093978 RepID=A0AAV4I3K1_9GAST|nr:hypothetical protein ElyMa_006509700 [Elysia marginata]
MLKAKWSLFKSPLTDQPETPIVQSTIAISLKSGLGHNPKPVYRPNLAPGPLNNNSICCNDNNYQHPIFPGLAVVTIWRDYRRSPGQSVPSQFGPQIDQIQALAILCEAVLS